MPVKPTQISFISDTNDKFESEFSKILYKKTGYYENDFDVPAQKMDNIIEVWRDESIFNEYYGISIIFYDLKNKDELQKANLELQGLLKEFNLENIHFTEILGSKNNFSPQYEREIWNSLNLGIKYIQKIHPQKKLSICKYPQEFTKRSIIKSAVSDLVAYVGTKVQSKLLSGVPLKKIKKEYGYILDGFKDCFNVTGFLSMDFERLIDDEYNLMCETVLGDKL